MRFDRDAVLAGSHSTKRRSEDTEGRGIVLQPPYVYTHPKPSPNPETHTALRGSIRGLHCSTRSRLSQTPSTAISDHADCQLWPGKTAGIFIIDQVSKATTAPRCLRVSYVVHVRPCCSCATGRPYQRRALLDFIGYSVDLLLITLTTNRPARQWMPTPLAVR